MSERKKNKGYLATVKDLSDRIVAAQTPIRILDAIKWDDGVREEFFRCGCRELPKVDFAYYQQGHPLAFNAAEKTAEFYAIERDISRRLGQLSPLAQIMRRICREYRIGRIYENLYLCRRWSGNSDSGLGIEERNRNDAFKDKIRTDEIFARQKMNQSNAFIL